MRRGKRGGGEREGERGKENEGEGLKVEREKGNSSSSSSNNFWILFFPKSLRASCGLTHLASVMFPAEGYY